MLPSGSIKPSAFTERLLKIDPHSGPLRRHAGLHALGVREGQQQVLGEVEHGRHREEPGTAGGQFRAQVGCGAASVASRSASVTSHASSVISLIGHQPSPVAGHTSSLTGHASSVTGRTSSVTARASSVTIQGHRHQLHGGKRLSVLPQVQQAQGVLALDVRYGGQHEGRVRDQDGEGPAAAGRP